MIPTASPLDPAAAPTPLQEAIRARARDTLDNAERLPKPSRQRKLLTGLVVAVVVGLLILTIDISVRVMHYILTVWYGDPAAEIKPAPKFDPTQPFYITMDPPTDEQGSSASSKADK